MKHILDRTNAAGVSVLLVILFCATSAHAQQEWARTWFDQGWSYSPAEIAAAGCDRIFLYTYDLYDPAHSMHSYFTNYMSQCDQFGIEVIVGIRSLGDDYSGVDRDPYTVSQLTNFITSIEQYSAVVGYYTADEPVYHSGNGLSVADCQTKYNVIKSITNKPVYMTFCTADLNANNPWNYRNTYDVMMFDQYLFHIGEPEFDDLEDSYYGANNGWKSLVDRAFNAAQALNKPFINVLQAYGQPSGSTYTTTRLPTYNEERFMTYYSLIKNGAQDGGVAFWCERWRNISAALPNEPYAGNGDQWLADVGVPVMDEMDILASAINSQEIPNAFTDSSADIIHRLFMGENSSEFFLLTVNKSQSQKNDAFTLNLPINWTHLYCLETGNLVPIVNGQFSIAYDKYEVKNFKLVLLGDANGDGVVSAGDYAAVQANFGNTGELGRKLIGDTNLDGVVSAGDYATVQANFGKSLGTSTEQIPEPSMITLLAFGLTAIVKRSRFAKLCN